MGRDVTGLCIDKKSNNVGKPNGINHVFVAPKIAVERDNSEVDHTANGLVLEDGHEKQDVLGVKSTNFNTGSADVKSQEDESFKPIEKKLRTPIKPALGSTAAESLQTSSPVLESPSLANEKQNSSSSNASGAETIDSATNGTLKTNDLQSPVATNKTEPISPFASTNTTEADDRKYLRDDDNLSLASSTATSVWTSQANLTVPVGPTFRCVERLERRKEYYAKLEEKHKALEAEKLECAARTKEEEEAAKKALRKTMAYKANPVPSFYREGPPPKVELKKLPVTRAKSPNLTRRKSCSDAAKSAKSSSEENRACVRTKRHSFGFGREGSATPSPSKLKDFTGGRNSSARVNIENSSTTNSTKYTSTLSRQNVNGGNKMKDSMKQVKKTSKPSDFADISVVEGIAEVADHIADISVVEENKKTYPVPVPELMEPDAAIVA